MTFTTRAAGEMRARLRRLGTAGVQARTFHSAALRQARYFWPTGLRPRAPAAGRVQAAVAHEAMNAAGSRRTPPHCVTSPAEIEWAKVTNVRPDAYAASRRAPVAAGGIRRRRRPPRIFAAYEEVKRDRGRIDMEDVLLCAAACSPRTSASPPRSAGSTAGSSSTSSRTSARSSPRCSTSGSAAATTSASWATRRRRSTRSRAPERPPARVRRPAPGHHVIQLVRNYRSTPQVIEVANQLLAARRRPERRRGELRAAAGGGPAATFTELPDEVGEAERRRRGHAIAAAGTPWREIAVLFRINAQSEPFEEALSARGVPYVVRGVERFFDRPEVRQAVTLMRGSLRAGEVAVNGLVDSVSSLLGGIGWSAVPPAGGRSARNRWESLQALLGLAQELAAVDPTATLGSFVAEIERRAAGQHAPVAEGVTLATLHAAKGLEWEAVFLAGIHEGTVPIVYADTAAAVEEERRLLYVGVTRARRGLSVSWSVARSPGARATRGALALPRRHPAAVQGSHHRDGTVPRAPAQGRDDPMPRLPAPPHRRHRTQARPLP